MKKYSDVQTINFKGAGNVTINQEGEIIGEALQVKQQGSVLNINCGSSGGANIVIAWKKT